MAPWTMIVATFFAQSVMMSLPQGSFSSAFTPSFPLKAHFKKSVSGPLGTINSLQATPHHSVSYNSYPFDDPSSVLPRHPSSYDELYPVPSVKCALGHNRSYQSPAYAYGKQFLMAAGVSEGAYTDEQTIIAFMGTRYFSFKEEVHFVLENSSHKAPKIKKQLKGMASRFAGKTPAKEQVEVVKEYASSVNFLRKMNSLDEDQRIQILFGLTYKLVVDSVDQGDAFINVKKLKVWMAFAMPLLARTDPNIKLLKIRLGDFHQNPDWISELHLNSFAKHSARRIYRHRKSQTVIAETLDEQGQVTETEMIEKLPSGAFNFVSYDAKTELSPFGMIRNHRGQAAIRPTPDVCYGCHYNLKTREFNVVRPSFADLNLRDADFENEELLQHRRSFAKPGERMVIHQ